MWQPIETAPTSKEIRILAYVPDHKRLYEKVVILERSWDGGDWTYYAGDDTVSHVEPTHWMPLPDAPQEG